MVRWLVGVWVAVPAATLFLGAVAGLQAGTPSAGEGAFQGCLQALAKQWFDAKVELVVNGDPAVGDINDAAVASWTIEAINTCAAKTGGGDPASEHLFARYMAHWREHIDAAAADLKRRAGPD